MEERVSGFEERGDWVDVVEHGERMTAALRDVGRSGEAVDEFDEWRPKVGERLQSDMREKTAEQAHVEKGPGEDSNQSPREDLQKAGEELTDAYEQLDGQEKATEEWLESIRYVVRSVDSLGRKTIRSFEDTIYMRLMTRLCPLYFDNQLISANLSRHKRKRKDSTYALEVNINNDELKTVVREQLTQYENEQQHRNLEVETDTETAKFAEGIEMKNE